MADEQSPSPSELSPEQEAAVRALLAEARHDQPLPEHVADRLDRVLVGLGEERDADAGRPVDLTARRRRRNAGRLLVAAAALVVAGGVAGQFLRPAQDGADSGSADAPAAGSQARTTESDDAAGLAESGSTGFSPAEGEVTPETFGAAEVPVRLYASTFDRDVRRLARDQVAVDGESSTAEQYLLNEVPGFECPPAAYGDGTLFPAYYEEQPTVLAFRPPLGSRRVAELLRCGTAEQLRSVTISR